MGTQQKILIVDDDENTQSILLFFFKKAGYSVFTAYDGRDGLEKALANQPDIVISDVMMPKMDGYELCRELKRHPVTRAIPVMMLTAQGDSDAAVEGFQAGADDYISKPFDTKEVLARVERTLRWSEQKPESVPKISGNLTKIPLFDLISFCEEHRINGVIHLARWEKEGKYTKKVQGKIHLHLGEIIAIQCKDIDDVTDALDELLEWQDGTFTIEQEALHLPAIPGNDNEKTPDRPVSELEQTERGAETVKSMTELPDKSAEEDAPLKTPDVQEQPPVPQEVPYIKESIHRILDELKIQSGNLDYADVADWSGEAIHTVGNLARTKSPSIRDALKKVRQFSERVSQELDLGSLDETMILSETGLVLQYQVENFGTMNIVAPKEDQGMMRWNCNDALEKIMELLPS
ncbi:hypothetical protein CSA56_12300 [candidate division KSB3 bacterium]|uniref:Response regulatory domain-containing protein n=1 Tax=candidate division KSB3 bacterium TaxID=2044937 RepID=A0A2G6KCI0_9BACT|nr:MAG: hypothetical protein CSA56_12300 [candidate division KSB3 bacterium]